MKKNFKLILLSLVCIALALGCKKKKDEPAPLEYGELLLHIHSYVNINEVDGYNIIYTSEAGRKISVEMAQMYISHMQLVRMDGSVYEISDSVLLVKQSEETYYLADVPAGNYKGVRFHVGLNATQNQLAANSFTSGILNHSEMWLSSSAQPDGYVFANFKGKIDTTVAMDADDASLVPFEYRIGTNTHYTEVIMPEQGFTIEPNQSNFVHLIADYMKLFSGVNLRDNPSLHVSTTSDNSSAISTTVANNLSNIFSLE
jgi:hypothetical protein